MSPLHLPTILYSFFLALSSSPRIAQSFTPPSSYQLLDSREGALLYRRAISDGNEAYLQVINLQKIQIDQLPGEVDNMTLGDGKYYKGEGVITVLSLR